MKIRTLTKIDEREWDNYVLSSEFATFYHLIGWSNVVKNTYGHKPYYLIAEENGLIKGILPLFIMKNKILGSKIISVPFAPYGGVCADDNLIENQLILEAKKLTSLYNLDYLEIKNYPFKLNSETIKSSPQVTSILSLDPDPNNVWKKIKKNRRRGINKGTHANMEIIWSTDRINDFYDIYSRRMRFLGSPAHDLKFFKNIIKEFPNNTDIVFAKYKGIDISCIFLLYFKETVILGWGAADDRYLKFYPVDFLYWEAIKHCCENGYKFFDFGRSILDSGVHRFKDGFGPETINLCYQYYTNSLSKVPDNTTLNPKRQKFSQFWKILPLSLTKVIGPKLRKEFP